MGVKLRVAKKPGIWQFRQKKLEKPGILNKILKKPGILTIFAYKAVKFWFYTKNLSCK